MQISKAQIRSWIDSAFSAIKQKESGHPLVVMVLGYLNTAADTAGVDAIAAELAKIPGVTIVD